jgi:proteasome lid subunit RPN8/RPN11
MSAEKFIKDIIASGFEKLFDLDKLRFKSICIGKDIIESIIELAIINNPKEFVAFFKGYVKDNKLILDSLVYQQYYATTHSATPIFHFNDTNFYGSVHSHPSYNNNPSQTDIRFFRKIGIVNCIICKPYKVENVRFFNHEGDDINVEIIDTIHDEKNEA